LLGNFTKKALLKLNDKRLRTL